MYELLDQHRMCQPKCLDDFKNLKDLLDRFEVSTHSTGHPALKHLISNSVS